jgi:CDP-glucose 4,6-dehydratase
MEISEHFWHGRHVFLTGHTGFKGGWLALALRRLGAQVFGYSLAPSTHPAFYNVLAVQEKVNHECGDIRDIEHLRAAIITAKPSVVFHLAAQPIVRQAFADPLETLSTNVMGTANLLQALRGWEGLEAVVTVTSDKVYDNVEWDWPYRENDRLGGKEPYGVSKACCELVVDAFRQSYFQNGEKQVALATVRAGNIIGGGDWSVDRLIPDAVRAFTNNEPLVIRNPLSIRPWQHVCEPVRGYLGLAQMMVSQPHTYPRALNFGPPDEDVRTVEDLSNLLADLWGEGARWIRDDSVQPYEARTLTIDSQIARRCLGWRPRWTFEQSLAHTVDWYRAYYNNANIDELTMRQLEQALFA